MCDARAEVTCRVDGVAGGATEGDADTNNEQCHSQRAKFDGGAAEGQDDEDQDERADDFGDEVPRGGTDGRTGGEGTQLVRCQGFFIEVLLVREPANNRTQEGAQQFSTEVRQGGSEITATSGAYSAF